MLKLGQNWGKIANYSPPPMLNKDRHPWVWVPWPYVYGTPTTGYLHNKTKVSQKNLRVNHYLVLRYGRG